MGTRLRVYPCVKMDHTLSKQAIDVKLVSTL